MGKLKFIKGFSCMGNCTHTINIFHILNVCILSILLSLLNKAIRVERGSGYLKGPLCMCLQVFSFIDNEWALHLPQVKKKSTWPILANTTMHSTFTSSWFTEGQAHLFTLHVYIWAPIEINGNIHIPHIVECLC